MKIAFRRTHAIHVLVQDLDEEAVLSINAMSNEELFDQLDLSGAFYSRDEVLGVFNELPAECLDAEVVGNIMGWPIDLESYLEMRGQ